MLELCCWFGLELFCKIDVQPSSIWNQATIVLTLLCKRGVPPSSVEAFSECESEVFCKRCVHAFIKTDNCRAPLCHYLAVNLHNRLNCLEDGISMSKTLFIIFKGISKFDGRNFDRNWSKQVFVSPIKFWNSRDGCPPPFCITPSSYN